MEAVFFSIQREEVGVGGVLDELRPELPDEDVGVVVERLVQAGAAGEDQQREEQDQEGLVAEDLGELAGQPAQHARGGFLRLRQGGGVAPDAGAGDQADHQQADAHGPAERRIALRDLQAALALEEHQRH
jgi:hypothetical protein